jgi:tetratricopeptide (TPR) repeat protein
VPEAVKVNTQILELDPDNLPALTRRGLCYLKLGKYLAAKKDPSRALQLYSGSSLVKEAPTDNVDYFNFLDPKEKVIRTGNTSPQAASTEVPGCWRSPQSEKSLTWNTQMPW